MQTMDTVRVINGIETEAEWLNYSSDGNELLVAKRTGIYTLINVKSGELLAVNKTRYEEDLFSPTADVRKYARWNILEDGVSIHDTLTGDELLSVADANTWHVSYDGTLLLTRNNNLIIQIWDIETGEIIFNILPPGDNVPHHGLFGAGFTSDGLVWVNYPQYTELDDQISWYSPIQFWDISSGETVLELDGNLFYSSLYLDPTHTYALAWGTHIQSYSQNCSIWDTLSKQQLPCPAGGNYWATFSVDGEMLAVSSGTDFNITIFATGIPGRLIALETDPTYYVEFNPDGKFLVTLDQHIHLWAVPSEGK